MPQESEDRVVGYEIAGRKIPKRNPNNMILGDVADERIDPALDRLTRRYVPGTTHFGPIHWTPNRLRPNPTTIPHPAVDNPPQS